MLDVRGLWKAFGGVVAVRDLTFVVREGEIVGLLGPNGSGKTTVFNLVTGLIAADRGEIWFAGTPIAGLPAHRRASLGIARTFQLVRTLGRLSVRDNVAVARMWGTGRQRSPDRARADADELLARVGLAGHAEKPAVALTLAERRRLEVARALAAGPRLLLLDEPLAGLSEEEVGAEIALFRRLRDEGITLVLVEHAVAAVRALCDRVVFLHAGEKVAEGAPDDVLAHPRVVDVYLGDG
ncbi:MAG: ABC transporter ATP-binding protein [Armatimonadota bacterium]|nr:ABC transporter ATP-binding protein [Armatimonadota bacterium]MDR7460782.1 ABC transporter ATP-binding protein [Armatimonadota bacterium]MDR7559649.1 ABC transporter ATP-binding protein [Armatimonadota bacterium]MDR7577116.1 ABC transporter ATP-binding protein [Armatimonadota bacterium]MDR7587225.1 ABC transporter ATP-binding protein [Armatimonadota bacterium]